MSRIGRLVNRILGWFGLRMYRTGAAPGSGLEFDPVFARLAQRGIAVATVIDVGASNGGWSERLRTFFPGAAYHLIEANKTHEAALEKFVERFPRTSFTIAAAADQAGEIFFDDRDPWGGLASHEATPDASTRVASTSIDDEVSRLGLTGPFLIKLDTHGFEVPILAGAARTLADTAVIVMETYNFHLTEDSLTFWEMCDYLQGRGFRPIDLLGPLHRPKDGAFWQVDIVFVSSERAEFTDNRYA